MGSDMLAGGGILTGKTGWSPWAVSLTVHMAVVLALLSIRATIDTARPAPERKEILMPLIYRPPTPIRPALREVVRTLQPIPPPKPARVIPVRQMSAVITESPRPATITAPQPVSEAALLEVPLAQSRLKAPDLPWRPAPPALPVKTGVFGDPGQAPNGHTPAPRLEVQTGAFGGPVGNARPLNGAAHGSGVHTGDFGDATNSGSPSGNAKPVVVTDAGFGSATPQAAAPRRVEASAPVETPVEVLWKPKPAYTDEARAKKLEGDVTLAVVFQATGTVHVVRVVRGLGSGLDESARTAAEQIRFRPGKKDGVPVDQTALVLIKFELS